MHRIQFPRAIWLNEVETGLLSRLREKIPAQITYKISGEAKIHHPKALATGKFTDSHHLNLTGTIARFPWEIYQLPFKMYVTSLGGFAHLTFPGEPFPTRRDETSKDRNWEYRELLKATDAEVRNYFSKR